jgi:dimethylglycine catabolism B
MRLPLVDAHTREHTYCAYCPKLCRFSCPVSTEQGRETTTPWGKMSTLHHVVEDGLPLSKPHAEVFWACTGCMRCRSFCAHDNEVAAALGAGRAEAVRHGVAPQVAYETIEKHPMREARAVRAAEEIFGERMKPAPGASRTTWVPGCTAAVVAPEDAKAALGAVDALAPAGGVRVEASRCCGLPLLEAGDREGFLTAARRMFEAIGDGEEAVFGDPGCLHALAAIAPSLGMRHGKKLRHLSELANDSLAKLGRVALEGDVRWHDPCRLGRGLGIYDPPRAVLARILGRPPDEMDQRRDRAECSGAGGQLPRTDRPTAEGIARERTEEHEGAGGGTLITTCPSSARAFRKQMPAERVLDLGALIARSLSG